MSGGSMDYVYLRIKEAAELTEDETITQLLMDIAKVLHDEEWAECCDISDAEYQDTLLKFKRKWLKQEPCEDCISRTDAIKVAKSLPNMNPQFWNLCDTIDRTDMIVRLADLPPAAKKSKIGRWIKSEIGGAKVCSICKSHIGLSNFKFCPLCGAKMKSEG